MTGDMWPMTHRKHDTWQVTYDMWHVTHDTESQCLPPAGFLCWFILLVFLPLWHICYNVFYSQQNLPRYNDITNFNQFGNGKCWPYLWNDPKSKWLKLERWHFYRLQSVTKDMELAPRWYVTNGDTPSSFIYKYLFCTMILNIQYDMSSS